MFRRDFVASVTAAIASFFAGIFGGEKRVLFGKGKPYEKWITFRRHPLPWRSLHESDGCGGESCRPLDSFDRIIRWIRVSERLPEIIRWNANIFGIVGQSKQVLAATNHGTTSAVLWEYEDGRMDWGSHCLDVTHWAELPAPPAVETPPVPNFKNYVSRYGTINKQEIIDAMKKAVGPKFQAPRS